MGKGGGGNSAASQLQTIATINAINQANQSAASAQATQQAAATAAANYTPPTPQAATPSASAPTQYMPSPQAMEQARNEFNARLRGEDASILGGAKGEDANLTQEERDRRRKAKLTAGGDNNTATPAAGTQAANTGTAYSGNTLGG